MRQVKLNRDREPEGKRRVLFPGDIERMCGTEEAPTNSQFREELLRAVRHAACSELTERQHRCFELFFEEGLTVREIARQLELSDSTVSRHVAAAREKVRRYASYCVFGSAPGGREGESRFFAGKDQN